MNALLRIRLFTCLSLLLSFPVSVSHGDVFSNVPEAAGYTLIYDLSPPPDANYRDGTAVPYSVDNSGMAMPYGFDRVAYYLELVTGGTSTNWVYVSMDDFTRGSLSLQALGLPHNVDNPVLHQTTVWNMNIFAAAGSGVTTGTGIDTGNIEMWPSNYGQGNDESVPGASDSLWDWGDGNATTGSGYGSFQVHNHGAPEVIFAYSRWGAGGGSDCVGIGTAPSGHPDYTFSNNAGNYTARRLQILVRARSTDPNSLASTLKSRVPEAATFKLIQDLSIPTGNLRYNLESIPYALDRSGAITPSIGRLAYYLELDSEWVYVSMDPFTQDATQMGVPSRGPNGNGGTLLQQHVTNMNVYASGGVTTGTDIQTGNIEFWSRNYGNANAIGIPNADQGGNRYDFGDTISVDGHYGSMQIHNHDIGGGAGETLLAFNLWGNSGGDQSCLGIGNRPTGDPDWTHAKNAASYATRRLQVLAEYGPYAQVPEAQDYETVYSLAIPNRAQFRNGIPVPYTIDNSNMVLEHGFDRVAYYLELEDSTGFKWVYVSMDDFTGGSLEAIGIPHNVDNPVAHWGIVNNMNIFASANAGVTTGTGLSTGNIEMWPSNYGGGNNQGIPNAGSGFDWGDSGFSTGAGHGSFQVHNHGVPQVLFGYCNWGGNTSGQNGLGIGTDPGGADWTFQTNTDSYTLKNLFILVRPRASAVDPEALAATVRSRVPEADGYELVQDLHIPTGNLLYNSGFVPYALDRRNEIFPSIGRIAYYLELDSEWVYVSMEGHTRDVTELGVPNSGPNGNGGAIFQQLVSDMNVAASPGAGVTTGTGIQTGNIEFWHRSYTAGNGASIPGASGTLYDFGDTVSAGGGYGSMQVHNHGAGETLMSFSRWGSDAGGQACLGIGNNPGTHPDWTHQQNASTYSTRHLQVLVQYGPAAHVPEAADYEIIYALEIPNQGNFRDATPVPYAIDNSDRVLSEGFDRVAYYLELDNGSDFKWIYVSMDDFSGQSLVRLGMPHNADNPVAHQQLVNSMNVYASANAGVTQGTDIQAGNVEMWPASYDQVNSIGIPGANGGTYDFGDRNTGGTSAGHGSFQIHNHGAGEVLFAYNNWTANGVSTLGIGTQPTGQPDWTFNYNATSYTVKNLFILVRPRANANHEAVALHERVPESENYELIYDLDIPTRAHWDNTMIPYSVDRSAILPPSFGRIAYYLELDSTWVYASMNAYTQDLSRIGVPSSGPNGNGGVTIQQLLANMNVYASSGSGIATGTGIDTGNIEFWHFNYGTANTLPVPNANGGLLDFGDEPRTTGDHGSMQIHNHDIDGIGPGTSGQTIFSYSHWNSTSEDNVVGIGSQPSGHPDWTFSNNAGDYATKHMQILVLPRVFDDVDRAYDFSLLYALEIPTGGPPDFHANGVPYAIDRSDELSGQIIHRVAYYLELKKPGGSREWVYVSFAPFTQDVTKLGVPNSDVGRVWQRNVNNMIVYAGGGAEARVTNGVGISTGNIEFWPNDYGTANEAGVLNASPTTYDFGDDVNESKTSGYGSMQIHNYGASQVVLAYSGWGASGGRTGCLGIGNQGAGSPDWTHEDNADEFEIANLFVLIQTPPPASQFMFR